MSPENGWSRLDPKTVLAVGVLVLAPLVPTLAIMLISGAGLGVTGATLGFWVVGALLIAGFAGVDWYFTWYRVTEERFELRKGVLSRSQRWIPRDRIRSVDLTADPMHRVLGLAVIKIGTGESGNAELKLDSLPKREGELLRHELLHTAPPESTPDSGGALATLHPAWLGYGALTASLIAIVWGAIGSAFGSFSELLESSGFFGALVERFHFVPLWMIITGGVLSALLTGIVGALLLSVEMWWGFRLTRENDTLRVRRGLLTIRSVSLEERRLRGVEIAEPMVLRWAGGARTNAVATGLGELKENPSTERKALLPPAPLAESGRVAAAALRESQSPAGGEALTPHPRAALRRRVTWALATVVPFVVASGVVAAFGWLPSWTPWVVAVVGAAVAVAAAFDAYRNLGHRLTGKYLISRRGTAVRRTVALQRGGIIGLRMRQSLFQRRVNLISIAATTAAGNGVYEIPDVTTEHGLVFTEEAVPGLLTPFLERHELRSSARLG